MAAARRAQTSMKQGCDSDRFPVFAVTVDVVILHVVEGRLHVLLVRRGEQPFEGAWAIPGGFKRPDETLDEAAAAASCGTRRGSRRRATSPSSGAYGDPGRDPRGNVVTVAYLAVAPAVVGLAAGTDAVDARLWPVADVRRGGARPRLRPPTHRRRRRRARRRGARGQRPRHRVRRPDVHAHPAAERVRGRLGRPPRSRQLPSQSGQ